MTWKTFMKNHKNNDHFSFDQFFDFGDFFQLSEKGFDVEKDVEKDGKYIKTLNCPGFNEKNLTIQRTAQNLTIKGETETRKYEKTYTINDQVTDISAVIADGVLTLTLTIQDEIQPETSTIEIKTE